MTPALTCLPRRRHAAVGLGIFTALFLLLIVPVLAATSPGALDRSFGHGGYVFTNLGHSEGDAVAIDGKDRIVAAGTSGVGKTVALARYEQHGYLDRTFSGDGVVVTDFGYRKAQANSTVIDSRGRIVVAGASCTTHSDCPGFGRTCKPNCDFLIARYKPNGHLDPSFGKGGTVTTDFGGADAVNALALDSRGRIVAAGSTSNGVRTDFALARYKANGQLDPSFGNGGMVTPIFLGPSRSAAASLAIGRQGGIVVAGRTGSVNKSRFALARLKPNGHLDRRFRFGGELTMGFAGTPFDAAKSVAIGRKGRILVAGRAGRSNNSTGQFALARLKPNGHLDPRFGTGGKVTTHVGHGQTGASSMVIDPQGRIVATGPEKTSDAATFALARYKPNGHLDRSFGTGGKVTTKFGHEASSKAVAIDSKQRIVVVGADNFRFAVARYLGH